jgi:trimethylamine---corrinoid protein Co-methyltransferase
MITSNYSAQMAPFFRKLSDDQLGRIHAASLEILERTGVRLHHDYALALLKKAGAAIDDDGRVRIPSYLVEWALRTAPKRISWADRAGKRVMHLEGRNVHYGPGSDCPNVIDVRTGERRPGTLADVEEAVTRAGCAAQHRLPDVVLHGVGCSPGDR